MPAFLTFDEFSDVLSHATGMLVFVLTSACEETSANEASAVEQAVKHAASVHAMCASVGTSPTLVFYEGGDPRPLLTFAGSATNRQILDALDHAARIAAMRPSVVEEAATQESSIAQTAHMLRSEPLEEFPPFFRMARTLARDAWFAAQRAAEGLPLLLPSEAAAARQPFTRCR